MKVICVSCNGKHQKSNDEVRYTFRNGERLPLCQTCWDAALQVQAMLKPASYAEEAKRRYEIRQRKGL